MNTITIKQAARWLAVTNMGGPHNSRGIPKGRDAEHLAPSKSLGFGGVKPITGTGCDIIWNSECQIADEGYFEGLEAEAKSFEKSLRSKKHGKFYRETLAKEGLEVGKE